MLLPDVHAATLAFVAATRPWATTPQDFERHATDDTRNIRLTSVGLVVSRYSGVSLKGHALNTPSPSHHHTLHTSARLQPSIAAAQALWDILTGHAPILAGNTMALYELIGHDGIHWNLALIHGISGITAPTPKNLAAAMCAVAHILKDRPRGEHRFEIRSTTGSTIALYAASAQDAMALWYAAHLTAPDAQIMQITETHPLDEVRALCPDPRQEYAPIF